MNEDYNIDNEIADLEKKLEEARRRKEEMNIPEITIFKMVESSGAVHLKLNKFHDGIVNVLRRVPGRVYSGENNIIPALQVETFLKGLEEWGIKYKLIWTDGVEDRYKEFINRPDLKLEYDENKSTVWIDMGPRVINQRLYLQYDITSFKMDVIHKRYRFSVAEAFKFPTVIEKYYPKWTIEYDPKLKEIIFAQVERQRLLAEIATASDWDIPNPFTCKDSRTGEQFNLKPVQRVAVKFAEITGGRALIALPMGAGKTAISIAHCELAGYKKVLVICPAPAKINWRNEIKKFTGQNAFILYGATPDTVCIDAIVHSKYKYYIINYDLIGRASVEHEDVEVNKWAILINAGRFDFIVPDEAHRIKNTSSKRSRAVMSLQSTHWLPLTGTPIVNRPGELYPNLHLLDPVSFSDEATFNNQFMDIRGNPKNVDQLLKILSQYMFRRTSEQIFGESLEPNRIPFSKELSPQARANYQRVLEGVYVSLRNPDFQRNVTSILAELTRCKQICSADNCETSVDLALDAIEETDKKVLIFSQFKESQATINGLLGNQSAIINGEVGDERRYELLDEFQNPNSNLKVIVTNITEALTMTEAHTVIFNDIWWTPKDHHQAEGRAFGRVNDPHSGNSYYLQNENTIDEFLVALLQKKLNIFKQVIDGTQMAQEAQLSIAMELINHLRSTM